MRVVSADAGAGLATCVGGDGRSSEVMIALVEDVEPGDLLLVHAATALVRLDEDALRVAGGQEGGSDTRAPDRPPRSSSEGGTP